MMSKCKREREQRNTPIKMKINYHCTSRSQSKVFHKSKCRKKRVNNLYSKKICLSEGVVRSSPPETALIPKPLRSRRMSNLVLNLRIADMSLTHLAVTLVYFIAMLWSCGFTHTTMKRYGVEAGKARLGKNKVRYLHLTREQEVSVMHFQQLQRTSKTEPCRSLYLDWHIPNNERNRPVADREDWQLCRLLLPWVCHDHPHIARIAKPEPKCISTQGHMMKKRPTPWLHNRHQK